MTEPTEVQANACVREGIRRVLWWSAFPKQEYESMSVRELRAELESSLAPEIRSESMRFMHLNVGVARQFRKKGWRVKLPSRGWYVHKTNQGKKLTEIATFVLEGEIKPSRRP